MTSLEQILLRADQLNSGSNSSVITPVTSLPQFMTYDTFTKEVDSLKVDLDQVSTDVTEMVSAPSTSPTTTVSDEALDRDYESYLDSVSFDTEELLKAVYFMEDSLSGRLDGLTSTLSSFGEKSLFIEQQTHKQLSMLTSTFNDMYDLQHKELNKTLTRKPNEKKPDVDPTEVILLDHQGKRHKGPYDVNIKNGGGGGGLDIDLPRRRRRPPRNRRPGFNPLDALDFGGNDKDKKPKRKNFFSKIKDALSGPGSGKKKAVAAVLAAVAGVAMYKSSSDDAEARHEGMPIDPSTIGDAPVVSNPAEVKANTNQSNFFGGAASLMPSMGGLATLGIAIPGMSYGYDTLKGLVSSPSNTNTSHISGTPATMLPNRPPVPALPAPQIVGPPRSTSTGLAHLPDAEFDDIPRQTKANKVWNATKRIGKVARNIGPINMALGAADTYSIVSDDTTTTKEKGVALGGVAGGVGGGWAGASAGAAAGAMAGGALGTVVPILGNAVGAAVGGVIGGIAGSFGGYSLGSDIGESLTDSAWSWFSDDNEDQVLADKAEKDKADQAKQEEVKLKQSKSPWDIKKEPWMFTPDGVPFSENRNPRIQKQIYNRRKKKYEAENGKHEYVEPVVVPETNSDTVQAEPTIEAEFSSAKSGGTYEFTKDIAENAGTESNEPADRPDYVNFTKDDVAAKANADAKLEATKTSDVYSIKKEPWMFNSKGDQYNVNSNADLEKRVYANRKRAWKVRSRIRKSSIQDAPSSPSKANADALVSQNTSNVTQLPNTVEDVEISDVSSNVEGLLPVGFSAKTSTGKPKVETDLMADLRANTESMLSDDYKTSLSTLHAERDRIARITKDVPAATPLDPEKLNSNTGATERVERAVNSMATAIIPANKGTPSKTRVVRSNSRPRPTLNDIPIILDKGGLGLINLGYI